MSDVPAFLAATAALVTAVGGLVKVNRKLDVIHVLVNSRLTEALSELEQLKLALKREEAK